jgi:hypothetical protein
MKSAKIRLRNKHIFMVLLVVSYAIRAITDAVFVAQDETSIWVAIKYVPLVLAIVFGFVYLKQGNFKYKGVYILKSIVVAAGVFLVISCGKMVFTGVYSAAILKLLINMIIPAVVAVLAMSILTSDDIYLCFSWILCITFAVYCALEIGLENFTSKQFLNISFAQSLSPFESHYTSGTALALCAYFAYYRKRKVFTIVSLVFSLLTFKRLMVVYSVVVFVLPLFVNIKRRISKSVLVACASLFTVLTLLYYWGLVPENQDVLERLLGIDSIEEFTSTRSLFFVAIYKSSTFVNFGWGACEAYIGKMFEMDLLQILIELSALGLVVFVFSYWKIAGTTRFSVIYMLFNFTNMLTSHSIQNAFIWSIVLIILAQIERDNVGDSTQTRKWRIVFRNRGRTW